MLVSLRHYWPLGYSMDRAPDVHSASKPFPDIPRSTYFSQVFFRQLQPITLIYSSSSHALQFA